MYRDKVCKEYMKSLCVERYRAPIIMTGHETRSLFLADESRQCRAELKSLPTFIFTTRAIFTWDDQKGEKIDDGLNEPARRGVDTENGASMAEYFCNFVNASA